MTAVVARGRRRARPSLAIIAAAAATVFASLLAGSLLSGRHAGSHHGKATAPLSQAHALIGYSNAIFPATEQAGRTIVAGIKPDIADFRQGRISAEVWTADMQTRRREFAAARATFAKARAKAPAAVKDAPAWFDKAFHQYDRAVQLFLQAAAVDGAARADLVARGTALGEAGDRAFDRGTALIQSARRAWGMGPDPRFSGAGAHEGDTT